MTECATKINAVYIKFKKRQAFEKMKQILSKKVIKKKRGSKSKDLRLNFDVKAVSELLL